MMSTISSALILIPLLMSMAFFTLLEQKLLGYIQIRKGPNKPSLMAIPQPAADGVKLFLNQSPPLTNSNSILYQSIPPLTIMLALMLWAIYPTPAQPFFLLFALLLFLCISSLSVYSTMLAGWSSNAKYSLLGALRGIAQTISYEISMALILICALILLLNFNTFMISSFSSLNLLLISPMLATIWFTTTLAETNRSPFDFAEGESELVSGFNTEYAGPEFAFIFMAEYLNIILMSMLTAILFIQATPHAWHLFLSLKTTFIAIMFIMARGTLPRLRYDRLMLMTWTSYLPISLCLPILLLIL